MLGWLALVSVWNGRSVWSVSNLLATTFYGEPALGRGFRWMTLSGLALHLCLTGLVGVAFAFAVRSLAWRGRIILLGLLAGLAWYYACFGFFWRHVNPLVTIYSPQHGMLFAHLALGAFLGFTPRFRRALDRAGLPPEVVIEPPPATG